MTDETRPAPISPSYLDGRRLGEPPWETFVQMAMDLGSPRHEAERMVAEARVRYRLRRAH